MSSSPSPYSVVTSSSSSSSPSSSSSSPHSPVTPPHPYDSSSIPLQDLPISPVPPPPIVIKEVKLDSNGVPLNPFENPEETFLLLRWDANQRLPQVDRDHLPPSYQSALLIPISTPSPERAYIAEMDMRIPMRFREMEAEHRQYVESQFLSTYTNGGAPFTVLVNRKVLTPEEEKAKNHVGCLQCCGYVICCPFLCLCCVAMMFLDSETRGSAGFGHRNRNWFKDNWNKPSTEFTVSEKATPTTASNAT